MNKFLNSLLMEGSRIVEKPIDLTRLADRLTDKSIKYIKNSVKSGNPFLLVHSFAHVHTPLYTSPEFTGVSAHGPYGDVLLETDHCIQRILNTLREEGVDENTLVYFTSDHGGNHPQDGDKGGYNGVFRGGKGNGALEGGMRVPGVIRWPGKIQAGSEFSEPTSHLDILPTLADIVGLDVSSLKHDGTSLLPLLTSRTPLPPRTLYHFCGSRVFAVRTWSGRKAYKWILRQPLLNQNGGCDAAFCPCYGPGVSEHTPPLLIDIEDDVREEKEVDEHGSLYRGLVNGMQKDLERFESDVEVTSLPSQLNSWRVMPHIWMQPLLHVQYTE
jgi:hypothetical protein